MFRTIARNNILRETLKKSIRSNAVRSSSVYCCRKKHINKNLPFTTHLQKWSPQIIRHYSSNYPPHNKVLLPALSPTMEGGKIVSWAKNEGDKLNEGDLLAEIETDKATMGFETPEEGYLAKILIPAGTANVPVGKLVCIIVENQEDVAKFKDFKDDGAAAPPAPPAAEKKPAPAAPAPAAPSPPPSSAPAPSPTPSAPAGSGERVYVSPMAKRLAEQRQIRLQGKGSGLFGSITSKDLDKLGAAQPPPSAAAPPPSPSGPKFAPGSAFVDIPVSNIRAVIAKRLLESKTQIPHYYLSTDICLDNLIKLRAKVNKKLEKSGVRVTINDFIIKATAAATKKVPDVNVAWLGENIRQYKNVDVSVAVSTSRGLITPIVFEANDKTLTQISKEMKELVAKARENKLQPHEFQGGTVSVSNLGMFNISQFCAIINPPQSLIIAVGSMQTRLVADPNSEHGFREEKFLRATGSFDHRTVDGALGAEWMAAFCECIEDPAFMIV